MRTIILGAGASVDAGYPLTSELYEALDGFYLKSPNHPARDQWKKFKKYLNSSKGRIGSILKSHNLELVLTLPDLLNASLEDYEETTQREIERKNSLEEGGEYWRDRVCSKNHMDLQKAKNISELFLTLIEGFFGYRSFEEQIPSYYINMLQKFDNVITTNWDSLSERTLLACNQWSPFDGYGFKLPDEEKNGAASQKFIYKLHGSVGWRRENQGNVFLSSSFRKYLHDPSISFDRRELPGNSKNIFITPSYLKQLNDQVIIEIWQKAHQAISNSSEIYIVGYSLPAADVAIRALLLGVSGKNVKIIDPCPNNRQIWDEFLGVGTYSYLPEKAINHFKNLANNM